MRSQVTVRKVVDIMNLFQNNSETSCEIQKVEISLNTEIKSVIREKNLYILETENKGKFECSSLVIATGGLSIPKIGASDYGYKIANQFNLKVTNLYPALVPLTFKDDILEFCKSLAGVSIEASVKINKTIFNEGLILPTGVLVDHQFYKFLLTGNLIGVLK